MRNLKKFLALVLAMLMTFSLMVTVNAAPATPTDFDDGEQVSSTYAEAVNVLSALGIVKGQGEGDPNEGKFMPKSPITRAEVAAMIYRVAHNDADDTQAGIYKDYNQFPDVKETDWFAGYVNYCAISEIIRGYNDSAFHPRNNVTGYEVLAMVLRMIGYGQNGEFEGYGWQVRTATYARTAGLTKHITEGTLGQPATREVVAEIIFQALQADLMDYNAFDRYHAANVLIENTDTNRDNYKTAISGGLKLPVNADLMYVNYGIVGKANDLAFDAFGRPSVAWVTDKSTDVDAESGAGAGDATKYIPNPTANAETEDEFYVTMTMTPVKVYDNAIDECHLTKEINNDKSIAWANITEVVNGEALATRTDATNLDALHTTTKWIGTTGRTTEIYKISATDWRFVYIDTFLGEVTSTTDAVKDTAGHTIIAATATVELGNNAGAALATLTLDNPNGKYKKGDLVLVQTPNAKMDTTKTDNDGTGFMGPSTTGPDAVDAPEKAPLEPNDVPCFVAQFNKTDSSVKSILLSTGAETVKNVTIQATVGAQDAKMGIIASNGTTYMASNTFLASRTKATPHGDNTNTSALTVLTNWYDVDVEDLGITNSMIGRTYDIVLDHHGYIIGMKEVLDISDGVGVITGIDSARVGSGKYVSEVEAYMTDGTTKTFQLLGDKAQNDGSGQKLDVITDSDYGYFPSLSAADAAWQPDGMYEKPDTAQDTVLNVGSLVQFKSLSYDGKTFYKIVDWDQTVTADLETMVNDTTATGSAEAGAEGVGTLGQVATGVTGTLNGDTDMAGERNATMLNNNSVIFVAEYEYRYNTSGNNDGSNINKTYKVYEGFKKMPTITGLDLGADGAIGGGDDATNILYQQLGEQTGNGKYVLIYAQDTTKEYTIKAQDKIAVDDSYLVLSRGATYATYSEYNVLKNGVKDTLQVSNANTLVNAAIEATMTSNELLLVTGRNAAGYVTSVTTVKTAADASNTNALLNTGNLTGREIITGSANVAYSAGVLKTTAAGQYLTVDDNVKVQLVNRDQKTVTDIDMSTALVYMTGKNANLGTKNAVFELNELGYICALYVIE